MKSRIRRILKKIPMPEGLWLRFRRSLIDHQDEFDWLVQEQAEAIYHSRRLLRRARSLRLPIPPTFENNKLTSQYQRDGIDGNRYYLSLAGEQEVRKAIREEEKFRSEVWSRRLPYLTALTGLIGTITGLVALLVK